MAGHSVEEINNHVKTYIKVFGALLVLTVLTVAASYLKVGVGLGIFIGLLIAFFKGGLVASFFMHLKDDWKAGHKWVTYTMILTAFFFLLMIVITLLFQANSLNLL